MLTIGMKAAPTDSRWFYFREPCTVDEMEADPETKALVAMHITVTASGQKKRIEAQASGDLFPGVEFWEDD